MFLKSLYWIGLAACVLLIVSCFLPWLYYADLNQSFTGFYSYKNEYGRPGKFLLVMTVLIMVFMVLPKVWAKRSNLFLCALTVAYAFKTYVLFTSCYNNYCPQKLAGIYLMLGASVVMLLASCFPTMNIPASYKK
ncbi:MAG: hypothetical protein IPI66_14520 [Chitinophagaceae bacterium]|nr:hypothetical protein [Chitinophagaceae bacterium]